LEAIHDLIAGECLAEVLWVEARVTGNKAANRVSFALAFAVNDGDGDVPVWVQVFVEFEAGPVLHLDLLILVSNSRQDAHLPDEISSQISHGEILDLNAAKSSNFSPAFSKDGGEWELLGHRF